MSNTLGMKLYPDPGCDCFQDPELVVKMLSSTVAVAQAAGNTLMAGANLAGLCDKAALLALHEAVIMVLTVLAVNGTAIEQGSQEAQWETERLLEGMEARLLVSVRHKYANLNNLSAEDKAKVVKGAMDMDIMDRLRKMKGVQ